MRPDVLCSVVWAGVYGAIWATGQRMDLAEAVMSWQLAPLDALSHAPAQTLWFLHTQPPGWNALIALTMRLGPSGSTVPLQVVMLLSGIVLCLAVFRIAASLGASNRAASMVTLIATLNSQLLASGFSVRYELPLAALVAVLAALVARPPSRAGLVAVAAVGVAITMTRALYHPVWLVAVIGIVALAARRCASRTTIVTAALIPLIIVGGWMLKGVVQHGDTSLSSWTGMNLLRSVEPAVSADDLAALRAEGIISGVAMVDPFGAYEGYAPFVEPCEARTDVLALRDPVKGSVQVANPFMTGPPNNYNYECFIPVFDQAGADAMQIIRHHPGDWLEARSWALNNWFNVGRPDLTSPILRALHQATLVVYLAVPHPGAPGSWEGHELWVHAWPQSLALIALTAVTLVAGSRRAWRGVRARSLGHVDASVVVVAVTVAWTMLAGVGLELGEQDRFRSVVDPVVVAVGLALALRWRVERRR